MKRSKQLLFDDLVTRVQRCNQCPRMSNRNKVLGYANGNLDSSVVFIAEAPGRLGADRYGIPLYGDQAGRNFEQLIASAGLMREAIFITNTVLCNPRSANGNNDSPTTTEIRNCSRFLDETIDIVKPKSIAPLGTTALTSLNVIDPHRIKLSEDVGKVYQWHGYLVYPLYHPGSRAFVWRSKNQQKQDYQLLADLLSETT